MQKQHVVILLFLVSAAGTCGCRSVSERMMRKMPAREGRARFRADHTYRLDDESLEQMTFEGVVEVEDVNVTYQAGLEQQAECLAEQIDGLVGHIESSTSIDIGLGTHVYLLRTDVAPTPYEMNLRMDPNCFVLPLFVRAGEESCEAIVAVNLIYPYIFMHEMAEMSLVFHEAPGVVLPDAAGQFLMFRPRLLNYTRWFREGFANYAGYLACLELRPQVDGAYPSVNWAIHPSPFSSLGRVGAKLFRWHNYSPDRLDREYYSAAFGLFLLMVDQFGQESISEIVEQMQKQDYLNGKDLIRVVNEVLGVDIEKLADEFSFPEIGWKTRELTRAVMLNESLDVDRGVLIAEIDPNGAAYAAGFKEGDTILKVGEKSIKNELDLELAIYDSLDARVVDVTVWRKDGCEEVIGLRCGEL